MSHICKEFKHKTAIIVNTCVKKIIEHMAEIEVKCKAAVVDGMLCAAFITPMMERVAQKVETCKELLFLDTSGTMDRYGHYVVLIMCKGKTGGLPVGVLILDSQTEEAYTIGLKMFKSLYCDQKGPLFFMTDCADSERNAIHTVFPGIFFFIINM